MKLDTHAIAIKTAWNWHKNRCEDQWNKIEDLDINPHRYFYLIFDKSTKTCDGEKTAASTNVAGKSEYLSACRKLKLDPFLSPSTNINSKLIKELNIGPETLKLVQEKIGNAEEVIGIGNDFFSRI
jgi:hypothetical protein